MKWSELIDHRMNNPNSNVFTAVNESKCNECHDAIRRGTKIVSVGGRRYVHLNCNTPLLRALNGDYLDVAALLIENGANVNARDAVGFTPLHIVSSRDVRYVPGETSRDFAKLLVEHGANVNATSPFGFTPLHFASSRDLAKVLIMSGAALNAKDGRGQTPLHLANLGIAKLLIENGADIEAKEENGYTPLQVAVSSKYKQLDIAKLLIKHGANTEGVDLSSMDDHEDA